jgi:hypothetical protein
MTAHSKTTIGRAVGATLLGPVVLLLCSGQTAFANQAHRAAHAKKKKKPPVVLVHCASVTVNCKTDPHNRGPAGPTGPAGAPGAPGTAGQGIADRIRWSGAILSSNGAPAGIPLSSPSFAQAAGEDERLLGLVTVTMPEKECESGKVHSGELDAIVTLDGAPAGIILAGGSPYSPGSVTTVPIIWTSSDLAEEFATEIGTLPITSSAQTHTLAIQLKDPCNASGATHFTVDSVAIDVLRTN